MGKGTLCAVLNCRSGNNCDNVFLENIWNEAFSPIVSMRLNSLSTKTEDSFANFFDIFSSCANNSETAYSCVSIFNRFVYVNVLAAYRYVSWSSLNIHNSLNTTSNN